MRRAQRAFPPLGRCRVPLGEVEAGRQPDVPAQAGRRAARQPQADFAPSGRDDRGVDVVARHAVIRRWLVVLVQQAEGHQEQAGLATDAGREFALDVQLLDPRVPGRLGRSAARDFAVARHGGRLGEGGRRVGGSDSLVATCRVCSMTRVCCWAWSARRDCSPSSFWTVVSNSAFRLSTASSFFASCSRVMVCASAGWADTAAPSAPTTARAVAKRFGVMGTRCGEGQG